MSGAKGAGRLRFLAMLAAGLALLGCASRGPPAADLTVITPDSVAACRGYFALFDRLVSHHHRRDRQAAVIDGFPYLRIDRLLAALAPAADDAARFEAWSVRMQVLDEQARRHEMANLPAAARRELADYARRASTAPDVVRRCGDILRTAELGAADARHRLLARAIVPDNYSSTQRVLGLYPITALVVRASISRWQREVRRDFARSDHPPSGRWQRYLPPPARGLAAAEVATMLDASRDALGIPSPTPVQLAALFATHAPVWEIDTVNDDDRPGRPRWDAAARPVVDVAQPMVYTHASYTHFGGRVLLQLTYTLWFPARPPATRFDILAGVFDGLHWRVTLDDDGRPLLYDSIHPCGCYHLFFPAPTLSARPSRRLYEEPALVPQTAPTLADQLRLGIRIGARAHYIQQLFVDRGAPGAGYELADYDTLRSLPLATGGTRSLFAERGFVPGSERAERWLLWPMGIANPGAMRQWGLHATAFVGRRHFDDADLLERLFVRNEIAAP